MNQIESKKIKGFIILLFLVPMLMSGNYLLNVNAAKTDDGNLTQTTELGEENSVTETSEESPNSYEDADKANSSVESEVAEEVGTTTTIMEENIYNSEDGPVSNTLSDEEKMVLEDKSYSEQEIELLKKTYLTLYFDPQSFKISSETYVALDAFIEMASKFPNEAISIEGHANGYPNFENSVMEQAVSSDRSRVIANYLSNSGISASRITLYNCGSSQPLSMESSEQSLNDRVEVYFRDYNAKGTQDK